MKSIFRILLCICALSVVGIGAAYAGPMEDAFAAFERKDYATALKILRPLADQGYVRAQLNLGIMYANGEGVRENDVQAYKWLNLAVAAQGLDNAKKNKAIVEKRMTRKQIAEAQKLSAEWKPKK